MKDQISNNLKRDFDSLGDLTKWNLSLVQSRIFEREKLGNVDVKKVGGTVGKIVKDEKEQHWLLKKGGRTQIDAKTLQKNEDPEIVQSRDVSIEGLREGITESFNEKCAAQLFDVIKQRPEYLPEFALVISTFDAQNKTKKNYNKFKKDALKVYVASKIIDNNPSSINKTDDSHNIHLLDRKRPSHPKLLETVIDDVCENAVIMFLLSNYDVKIDNFVHPQANPEWMVPIDFGHARHDEKSSADIFDGIDLIRRARTGMTKVLSDTFSSQAMYGNFVKDDNHIGTQTFYYNNLKPRHFLNVIEAIKSDSEIEEKLRKTAYELTFGEPQEKLEYADIITTRVRNLVKLENIFQTINEKTFPNENLRDIVANSKEFEENLRATNHSKGKEFYCLIFGVFEKIEEDCRSIISMLEDYSQSKDINDKASLNAQIIAKVHEFNAYAREESKLAETNLEKLEEFYKDSEYLKSESTRKDSWCAYKNNIKSKLNSVFGMLLSPLEEENESESESEYGDKKYFDFDFELDSQSKYLISEDGNELEEEEEEEEENAVEYSSSKISGSNDEDPLREISHESPDWNLTKCDSYKQGLESLLTQTLSWQRQIKKDTKLLMTHLMAYDELQQVKQDYKERSSKIVAQDENVLQKVIEAETQRRESETKAKKPSTKPATTHEKVHKKLSKSGASVAHST